MTDLATIGFRAETGDLDRANQKLNNLANTGGKVEKKISGSMGSVSKGAGQAGIQIQQFVGQVQGGVNPMIALSQQATDLGFVLGVPLLGAVVGIAAAVGASLIPELLNGADATEDFEKSQKALAGVLDSTSISVNGVSSELAELYKIDASLAKLKTIGAIYEAELAMAAFKEQVSDTIGETVGSVIQMEKAAQSFESSMGKISYPQIDYEGAAAMYNKSLDEQAEKLGITRDQLRGLAQSYEEFKDNGDLSSMQEELLILSKNTANLAPDFRNFVDQFATLANKGRLAKDQMETLSKLLEDNKLGKGAREADYAYQSFVESIKNAVDPTREYAQEIVAVNKALANGDVTSYEAATRIGQLAKAMNDASESEFSKQVSALEELENQLGLTADEMIVYNAVQQSIARGDTAEQTAQIEAQTRAYVQKKNAIKAATEGTKEYANWLKQVESETVSQTNKIEQEILDVWDAWLNGDLSDNTASTYLDQLNGQIDEINNKKITVFDQIGDSTKDALSSIQDLYAQGSKEYQKLGIAIQAVSAAQAVYAVLNQASGEPYSAPARMAAMASMVASLGAFGVSLASIGGGFTDDSVEAQANQGLTVWGDKSESIANAIELTQDATSKLVGINTNMLSALQSMAQNLSNASALIARDSGGASFSGVNVQENFWDNFGFLNEFTQTWNKTMSFLSLDFLNIGGFIFDTLGKWLGGSSSVTDSGIKIIGDSITDMIDNMTVQAFQDIKYKKWSLGSTKRKTQIQDISDAVGGQFSLVLESMLDSVVYGAQALGISDSTIQSRVNAFEIATQEISLKDLSADEQQAEIEAVFSKIFDDLAVAVVPFAVDFQQVGEGLGETMSRLAVQMQVTQAASDQLGFSFGNASAEMNAFVSNELSAMVGGVSELAGLTSSFVDKFASDEKKLEINTNALNQTMSGVGLGIPATAEGFFNLMGTLDATTEAGRAQIAAMLQIQDVASDYYDLLEDAENERLAAIQATDNEFNSLTKNLRNMIVSMYDLGDAATSVSLDMALAAARQGNFELAKQFGGVDIQQADYGSFSEFAFAQAVAANKIDELANLTEDQVSVDERQLNVLEEINKNIINSYNPSALTSSDNTQVNAAVKQQQQDIEQMKYAQQTMAKNAAQTAKILQRIEGFGIDVRVIQ